MKNFSFMGVLCACSLLAVSCSKNEPVAAPNNASGTETGVKVNFAFQADTDFAPAAVSRFIPSVNQFEILAFRSDADNPGDYYFEKYVSLDDMAVNQATGKLEGSAYFQPGTYKFLANYANGSTSSLTKATWASNIYSNDKYMYLTSVSGGMPELFMGYDRSATNPVADDAAYFNTQTTYDIVANGTPNDVVDLTLFRAVARVDVQLIHVKNTGTAENPVYEEAIYTDGSDVFGGSRTEEIDAIQYKFANLNSQLNYVGLIPATTSYVSGTYSQFNYTETIKIGTGTSTQIDKDTFSGWDNVPLDVIGQGNAYIVGPYMMPANPTAASKPSLELTFKKKNDNRIVRSIPVINDLPLDRNKVTIVKIYVLGPDVFHTNVKFEVEVDQVWDTANEIGGIVIN